MTGYHSSISVFVIHVFVIHIFVKVGCTRIIVPASAHPNILQERPYISIGHSQRLGEYPLGFHNLRGLVDQFLVYYLLLSNDLFFIQIIIISFFGICYILKSYLYQSLLNRIYCVSFFFFSFFEVEFHSVKHCRDSPMTNWLIQGLSLSQELTVWADWLASKLTSVHLSLRASARMTCTHCHAGVVWTQVLMFNDVLSLNLRHFTHSAISLVRGHTYFKMSIIYQGCRSIEKWKLQEVSTNELFKKKTAKHKS